MTVTFPAIPSMVTAVAQIAKGMIWESSSKTSRELSFVGGILNWQLGEAYSDPGYAKFSRIWCLSFRIKMISPVTSKSYSLLCPS